MKLWLTLLVCVSLSLSGFIYAAHTHEHPVVAQHDAHSHDHDSHKSKNTDVFDIMHTLAHHTATVELMHIASGQATKLAMTALILPSHSEVFSENIPLLILQPPRLS